MSKVFFFFVTLLTLCSLNIKEVYSQTYTWEKIQGTQPYTSNIRPDGKLIMKGPSNDILSDWQELPFTFEYFGKEVSGYYASDNGYLTFDKDAQTSAYQNTALPSENAPFQSIFAYWTDLEFAEGQPNWSNEIRTITLGTAPNRFHTVMWVSACQKGYSPSISSLSFAIVLFEQGGFDIIYVAGRKSTAARGTIGFQNDDQTKGMMLENSPSYDFPILSAAANDDISYRFSYSNYSNDLSVISSNLSKTAVANTSNELKVEIRNLGLNQVTSFLLNYQINQEKKSYLVDNIQLKSNEAIEITHNIPFNLEDAGEFYSFKIWCDDINGSEIDNNHKNDTLYHKIFANLGVSGNKKVLVEQFTGAWCGWCPDGSVEMKKIEQQINNAVLVVIHAGTGADAMKTLEGVSIADVYRLGFPQALVDRYKFPDEQGVPLNRTNENWLKRTKERESTYTPVNLVLEVDYNEQTREANIKVECNFVDYSYPGELRLHIYIVEDNLKGDGLGWDQANYYSNNSSYPNHPYYSKPNPVKGYIHRNVVRNFLNGDWGMEILNGKSQPGQSIINERTLDLPVHYKPQDVKVVAYVMYHSTELNDRVVLNVQVVKLRVDTFVTKKNIIDNIKVLPNPALESISIKGIERAGNINQKLEIYNSIGNLVITKYHIIENDKIDITKLLQGLYFVKIGFQIIPFFKL